MCGLCTEVSLEYISSPLICTDYLHAYLIPLDCGVLKPCVSLNFFFSFNIIINSKRGGALKAGVLIVWYSHVVQALGNVGPRKPGSTKPKALG